MTVYFVQEGSPGNRIKIGFTDVDLAVRMRNLRTANAFPLTLLAAIPGTAKDEAEMHVRFNELRRHLEWFEPHPRLLGFIEALRMMWPVRSTPLAREDMNRVVWIDGVPF